MRLAFYLAAQGGRHPRRADGLEATAIGFDRTARIFYRAVDVYFTEPLPHDDPLHALHEDPDAKVTLTPHIGWQSPWTWVRDSQELWLNVRRSQRGEPIHHLV